ncbi:10413_t:CDS:2, partial [Entrophospora sp. SA101]
SAITVDLVRSHFKICSVTLFLSGPGISSGEYNSTSSVSIAGSTNLICNWLLSDSGNNNMTNKEQPTISPKISKN